MLDDDGQMKFSGGVPLIFSARPDNLGLPCYNWNRLAERNYDWWIARFHFNLHLFDLARIDHFRGMESFWSIPAGEETAINGEWVPARGGRTVKPAETTTGEVASYCRRPWYHYA